MELACSQSSVLAKACQESRASYIGVHDHLEKVSVQDRVISLVDEALKMMTTLASRERQLNREAKDQALRLFLHVHVSLPCTGGFPLQNFSGGKFVKEYEKVFFVLLDAMEKVLSRLLKQELTVSFELPNSNRYWSHPKLARVAGSWFQFRSVVHACAMGIEGVPGLPIKKAFRIMSNSEELCKRLEKRWRRSTKLRALSLGVQCQRPSTFLVLTLFVLMRRFVIITMRLAFVCTSGLWTLPFMVYHNTACLVEVSCRFSESKKRTLCWQTVYNQNLHLQNFQVSIVHV